MADLDNQQKGRVVIEDGTTGSDLAVNEGGSINVVSSLPTTPSTATEIVQENFADISTTTGVDTIYTITNGENLTINLL